MQEEATAKDYWINARNYAQERARQALERQNQNEYKYYTKIADIYTEYLEKEEGKKNGKN